MALSGETDSLITVRGNPAALARVTEVLCQFDDIEIGLVSHEDLEEKGLSMNELTLPGYYNFDGITSTEQWLGREHIMLFRSNYAPEIDKKTASHVFSGLIEPAIRNKKPGQRANYRPVKPEHITQGLGLITETREEAGFPPLSTYYYDTGTAKDVVKRVVKVGSLLTFHALLSENPGLADRIHRFHNPGSANRMFLNLLIGQLDKQVIS